MGWLAGFLIGIVGPLASRVLISLGVGITSYAGLTALTNEMIGHINGLYTTIPSNILSLLDMSGLGVGIGIITSAMLTRITLKSIRVFHVGAQ